jgi:divalent metal cation (Fe/Co/Zn/Cd) transporter
MIGVSFFALAAYLAAESIHHLAVPARPRQSVAGLAVTAAALVVMPSLAIAKRRTGQALGNRTLIADAARVRSARSRPRQPCSASARTPGSAGGGLTPQRRWSSPPWRSGKASKPGEKRTD